MEAYTFQRTDLASRTLAARERTAIDSRIQADQRVVIDLRNVASISESFADELFGVLVLQRGLGDVTSRLKLINATESVLRSIAVAMQRRSVRHVA
ncbi:STAS-like domain-containing protein [Pseudomonas aeruginosa]|uniref:STAS-like domain-containing protein n=1 Tax=Pseudomonas aeruginosa TaxID=287 RepID=UPI00053D382A|nr:STAS-like domain-containing protein [Pseudomonas aeruginosa]AUA81948.1 DUF4325 domain-containing protein [Pseudomonas aeruginosa]AUA88033.1 DUF4325 domain-containing protein [Pseudomonas aeruginosa]EKW5285185.1 STAS-like domain-containing protein [Pseudomonas aeruginosa]EKW5492561.1 STAS-like domain-containing protein [Pseudomonas aeruginosa]EMB0049182.1 STAS-like domain-containing protein [Pseudomonas aeruginosa]